MGSHGGGSGMGEERRRMKRKRREARNEEWRNEEGSKEDWVGIVIRLESGEERSCERWAE